MYCISFKIYTTGKGSQKNNILNFLLVEMFLPEKGSKSLRLYFQKVCSTVVNIIFVAFQNQVIFGGQ